MCAGERAGRKAAAASTETRGTGREAQGARGGARQTARRACGQESQGNSRIVRSVTTTRARTCVCVCVFFFLFCFGDWAWYASMRVSFPNNETHFGSICQKPEETEKMEVKNQETPEVKDQVKEGSDAPEPSQVCFLVFWCLCICVGCQFAKQLNGDQFAGKQQSGRRHKGRGKVCRIRSAVRYIHA